MLDYKITLKSKEEIDSICYDMEDGIGCDGVVFNYDVLEENDFYNEAKLTGAIKYDEDTDMYAYKITNSNGNIYVHLNWIDTFDGSKALKTFKELEDNRKQITRKYFLDISDGTLGLMKDLPTCSSCGSNIGVTSLSNGKHICNKCAKEAVKVHNYSFKPEPTFIGKQIKSDKDNEVWYGVEIEVSTNEDKLNRFMLNNLSRIYLKHDSSIRGFGTNVEVVTHPHSFSELMSKDSWVNQIANVPTNDSDGNGLHIHISRTAFVDDKHYSLFYFLLHKMNKVCTKVGGRQLTNYCSLSPNGKVHTKKLGNTNTPNGRTVYLNESNCHTVEARFFKGTTNPDDIKANIQLLESVVKYTKYHKKTVTSNGWFQYISQKSKKYKELLKKVGSLEDTENIKVIYKKPKYLIKTAENIKVNDIPRVAKLTIKGKVKECTIKYIIYEDNNVRVVDSNTGRDYYVTLDEIEYFHLEV